MLSAGTSDTLHEVFYLVLFHVFASCCHAIQYNSSPPVRIGKTLGHELSQSHQKIPLLEKLCQPFDPLKKFCPPLPPHGNFSEVEFLFRKSVCQCSSKYIW